MPSVVSKALSVAQDDVGSTPIIVTIMEKEGAWASAALLKKLSHSKQSAKLRHVAREKHPAWVDLPRKKIESESFS